MVCPTLGRFVYILALGGWPGKRSMDPGPAFIPSTWRWARKPKTHSIGGYTVRTHESTQPPNILKPETNYSYLPSKPQWIDGYFAVVVLSLVDTYITRQKLKDNFCFQIKFASSKTVWEAIQDSLLQLFRAFYNTKPWGIRDTISIAAFRLPAHNFVGIAIFDASQFPQARFLDSVAHRSLLSTKRTRNLECYILVSWTLDILYSLLGIKYLGWKNSSEYFKFLLKGSATFNWYIFDFLDIFQKIYLFILFTFMESLKRLF